MSKEDQLDNLAHLAMFYGTAKMLLQSAEEFDKDGVLAPEEFREYVEQGIEVVSPSVLRLVVDLPDDWKVMPLYYEGIALLKQAIAIVDSLKARVSKESRLLEEMVGL